MLAAFEHVTFGYAGVPVVEDVSFTLHEKERVGFLGGNGEGKTTILRLLTGELTPDRGSVVRKRDLSLGYLEQTGGFTADSTVYGAMEEVFEEDRRLLERLKETELAMAHANEAEMRVLAARQESLAKRIAARDSYHTDVRIRTVLNGMGFSEMYSQNVATMSGGERTKLKLCRLLLEEPELLVLDEPTNHLDMNTLFWLEDYLSSYRGALLIVSHDRYFLDRLTSRTLALENGKLSSYKGNYSRYKILREEERKSEERAFEKQQEEIRKLRTYVEKNIVRATTASSAQSRVKQLEKMEVLERPTPPKHPPVFRFSYNDTPYERILSAEHFDLAVEGRTLLHDVSFTLMRGQKCAILGDNGTGKTTLLKFLLSKDGRVARGRFVRIAYYDQENAQLDPAERVLDAFWGVHRTMSRTDAQSLLARTGLDAEDMEKKVSELSGGLKAKLALALLQAERGNVLVLDEPTNHLDLPAREALESALAAFDGTVLFVSHDRRFIEAIADTIVCLENGTLTSFAGRYDDFLAQRRSAAPLPMSEAKPQKEQKQEGYRSREERAKEAKKRSRIREIEARLSALEEEQTALTGELAACGRDFRRAGEITERLSALSAESDALYEEYGALIG